MPFKFQFFEQGQHFKNDFKYFHFQLNNKNSCLVAISTIMVRAKSTNQPVANYMRSQSLPGVMRSQVIPYYPAGGYVFGICLSIFRIVKLWDFFPPAQQRWAGGRNPTKTPQTWSCRNSDCISLWSCEVLRRLEMSPSIASSCLLTLSSSVSTHFTFFPLFFIFDPCRIFLK